MDVHSLRMFINRECLSIHAAVMRSEIAKNILIDLAVSFAKTMRDSCSNVRFGFESVHKAISVRFRMSQPTLP